MLDLPWYTTIVILHLEVGIMWPRQGPAPTSAPSIGNPLIVVNEPELSYKVHYFLYEFCDVVKVVIIHRKI
jgi:hypothetical protein